MMEKVEMKTKVTKWDYRYIGLAHHIAEWSSCLSRKVGALITVNRRIVATGYNGAPAGVKSCRELGFCLRKDSKSGENLDTCLAAHAEQNCLIQASKTNISVDGGNIYITTYPCSTCMKLIINAGIKKVFYSQAYNSPLTERLAKEAGVELIQILPNKDLEN